MPSIRELTRLLKGDEARSLATRAYAFASRIHRRHRRDGGEPYITHPLRAAIILVKEFGVRNPDLVAAALLHDVMEMSAVGRQKLEAEFGAYVARLVSAVTKPRRNARAPGWEARYYAGIKRAGRAAALIKLADRLDNVRDLKNAAPAKRARYARATRARFLPWARRASPKAYAKLRAALAGYGAGGMKVRG